MTKNILLFNIVLIFIFGLSCSEKKLANNSQVLNDIDRPESDTLLFNSGIRAILQDTNGHYWFGSHSEGICYYDGHSYRYFTTFDGLPNNQIRSIQQAANGVIWISTANGICSYDGWNVKQFPPESANAISDWSTTSGDLWFYATEDGGVNRFDGSKMNYLSFPERKNQAHGKSYGVTGITKDRKGKIWIATYNALFSYDGKTVQTFDDAYFKLPADEGIHIRSILVDSKDRIWIGNNGIGVLMKKGDSTIHFSKEKGQLLPMGEFHSNVINKKTHKNTGLQSVFAIEEDAAGNIWFGDRDSGAWKFDGESLTNYNKNQGLPASMVWTIYKDASGRLLFGMERGGIYQWTGEDFKKVF